MMDLKIGDVVGWKVDGYHRWHKVQILRRSVTNPTEWLVMIVDCPEMPENKRGPWGAHPVNMITEAEYDMMVSLKGVT